LIVANIYYAQPLIAPIATELGLPPRSAGLIVTLTQLGYGAGLLLIVPLADLVENRRLTLAAIALATLGLLGAGLLQGPAAFLACSLLIGFGSVAVQVLSPLAAHFAPAARRGRVVGDIAMGIMLGIMAARPAASFLAAETSWRTVFFAAAGLMALTTAMLAIGLPQRQPKPRVGYGALMISLIELAVHTPALQRRAFYQACLFAAFSLFWTTVPLFLADAFGLDQRGIALFALAGVSGAVAAPLSGRRFCYRQPRHRWRAVGACVAGRGGGVARFRRAGPSGRRVPRHIRSRRRIARPAQRALHCDLLPVWRARFGARRLDLRRRRLANGERDWRRFSDRRARCVRLRTEALTPGDARLSCLPVCLTLATSEAEGTALSRAAPAGPQRPSGKV
jgi:MFS family permease